jgi:hypothetical protein
LGTYLVEPADAVLLSDENGIKSWHNHFLQLPGDVLHPKGACHDQQDIGLIDLLAVFPESLSCEIVACHRQNHFSSNQPSLTG